MNQALIRRVNRIREQAVIRAWEYRQRNTSHGTWFRMRRALLDAAEAWVVNDEDADSLEREGRAPLPVGRELAPPRRMFFVSLEELNTLASRQQIAVRLSQELLAAKNLALISHADILRTPEPG